MRSRFSLALVALVIAAGCDRCASPVTTSTPPVTDASAAPAPSALPLTVAAPLPPPAGWTFKPVHPIHVSVAYPTHCAPRAPIVRAEVAPTTRFLADARALGSLVVADSAGAPPRLTGVAALTLDPAGASRDPRALPWFDPEDAPRLARAKDGSWIASVEQPGGEGLRRVGLWREGKAEAIGEGDALAAVDLGCADDRCALLTSRVAKVAHAGATVWLGAAGEPASRWRPIEIVPAKAESAARPLALAAVEGGEGPGGLGVTAALLDGGEVAFVRVEGEAAREVARAPATSGLFDVIALPAPVVMASATPVTEDGCAEEGAGAAGVVFERPGRPAAKVRAHAPPIAGSLRRLARGGLAAWIAPLGCKQARRVIYAVVLDAEGTPVGAPMPVGDGVSFAVAASGGDVDLFVQDESTVTWLRMTCAPP